MFRAASDGSGDLIVGSRFDGAPSESVMRLDTRTVTWADIGLYTDFLSTDFKRLVGDWDKDRQQFIATSPAKNAAKIKGAVMLTMGAQDRLPRLR